jgi:hypothetical protein
VGLAAHRYGFVLRLRRNTDVRLGAVIVVLGTLVTLMPNRRAAIAASYAGQLAGLPN